MKRLIYTVMALALCFNFANAQSPYGVKKLKKLIQIGKSGDVDTLKIYKYLKGVGKVFFQNDTLFFYDGSGNLEFKWLINDSPANNEVLKYNSTTGLASWGTDQSGGTTSKVQTDSIVGLDSTYIVVENKLEADSLFGVGEQLVYPMDYAIGLESASSQYAYHADTDELDMGTEDFGFGFLVKTVGTSQVPIIGKRDTGPGFRFDLNVGGASWFVLDGTGGSGGDGAVINDIFNDGNYYYLFVLVDRSGNSYGFRNGVYSNSITASNVTGSINNSEPMKLTTGSFTGDIDEVKILRFGVDGLRVYGTGAGGDLSISVGTSSDSTILYKQSTGEGEIVKLYRNPGAQIDASLRNANRTDKVSNGDAESDFPKMSGNYATQRLTETRDNTQAHGGTYSVKLTTTVSGSNNFYYAMPQVSGGGSNLGGLTPGEFYEATVWVYLPSGQSVTQLNFSALGYYNNDSGDYSSIFSEATTTTDSWVKLSSILPLSSNATGISIRITANTATLTATEYFYFDDVSVKRIGEVSYWKFKNSYQDETDNDLDLTPSGSPTFTLNSYQSLNTKRVSADSILTKSLVMYGDIVSAPDSFATNNVGSATQPFINMYADAFKTNRADYAEMWKWNGSLQWKKAPFIIRDRTVNMSNKNLYDLKSAWIGKHSNTTKQDSSQWRYLSEIYNASWLGVNKIRMRVKSKYHKFVGDTMYLHYNEKQITPGMVVMLDNTTSYPFDVKICSIDSLNRGWFIVSDNAGFVGGQSVRNGIPCTAVGRIKAYVQGPVEVGQFLTTKNGGGLQRKHKGTTNCIALENVPNGQVRRVWIWVGN